MVRVKHRYLLVNILYPDPSVQNVRILKDAANDLPYSVRFRQPSSDQLTARLLAQVIRDGVVDLFGDYGAGKIAGSLQVKYLSPATSTAIIRVSRDHYRLVWAALTYTTKIPKPVEQQCTVQVVRVSGTIKKAEEEAIRRARVSIRRARSGANGRVTADSSDSLMVDQGVDVDVRHDVAPDDHEDMDDISSDEG